MFSHYFGFKSYGRKTEVAGTKIVRCIEPNQNGFTVLVYAEVNTSTTAHILTVMKPLGSTTLSANAATGQAVVNLTADPGDYSGWGTADNAIATADYCALECNDGLIHFGTVTMSSLQATFATNLPCAADSGKKVWFFGVETDTNPYDGLPHARHTCTASVINKFPAIQSVAGFHISNRRNEPMLLVIDNATAASTLEHCLVGYSAKAGRTWTRKAATYVPTES